MKTTGAILALLAAISSSGTKVEARSYGSILAPRRYQYNRSPDSFGLMSEIFSMPVYMNSLMRQHQKAVERLTQSSAPRYSVAEDAETGVVELMMELPGVTAQDLKVEVLEDGKTLRIAGSRKYVRHGSMYESDFDQSFDMQNVDPERLKVSLSAGILRVQAPKKEKTVKRIPISVDDDDLLEIHPSKLVQEENVEEATVEAEAELVGEVDGLTITEDDN